MKSEGSHLPWESALLLLAMTVHLMESDFVSVQVGWGLSHSMDLSEAGGAVCRSLLSVIFWWSKTSILSHHLLHGEEGGSSWLLRVLSAPVFVSHAEKK